MDLYKYCLFKELTLIFIILIISAIQVDSNQPETTDSESQTASRNFFLTTHITLSTLALNEEEIYTILKDYFKSNSDDATEDETYEQLRLRWYLDDYAESTGQVRKIHTNADQYAKVIADHPLLSFRLIYRFTKDLKSILDNRDSKVRDILKDSLRNIEELIGWPNTTDLENAMSAILRIHHVYDANLSEFARGNIFGSDTKFRLRARHCHDIGKQALREKYFAYAIEWMEIAQIFVEEENDETLNLDLANAWVTEAINTHDLQLIQSPDYDPLLFGHKIAGTDGIVPSFSRVKRRNIQRDLWRGRREANFNAINFWSLCSGEDLRTEAEKSELFCWYERKSNPAWFINPLKIEQLAKTPNLVQIYEVVSDSLNQKIIKMSQKDLAISGLFTVEGDKTSNERTSLNSWISDADSLDFKPISRLVELITGLSVVPFVSSEKFQVATYTFGGHYEVHQDALKADTGYWWTVMGDRIATFMIYLSDVELGGFTAFPQAGIAARPVKGSAVFWYNLLRNGNVEPNSWHGACPVILGSKWVSNRWIRYNQQFSKRSCSLDQNE